MSFTTEQKAAIKAHILASPDLSPMASGPGTDYGAIAAAMSAPGATVVWRTSLTQPEIYANGFDWVQVDNLTNGQARIWEWLFDNPGKSMNPSKLNVRAGISECWKGTAAKVAVATVVLGHCKRAATRVEDLFDSGGQGTTADPATLSYEGGMTIADVGEVLSA